MWKDDWAVKSQREDMDAALQIERNKEMLEVSSFPIGVVAWHCPAISV